MKFTTSQIQENGLQVLEGKPQGMRWMELLRAVKENTPETPHNTVHGALHKLLTTNGDVVKVARGTYRLAKYVNAEASAAMAQEIAAATVAVQSDNPTGGSLTEQDFYASFAEWLEENDESTFATALGGSSLGGKWGTPDVIGVLRPQASDLFKFAPQIVTAEIKAVAGETVTAFGQAVAYRLFSHKTYIVVPAQIGGDDMDRLTALCSLHGIGLVTFVLNKDQPNYQRVVWAENAEPDVFYVNMMLDRLKAKQPSLLNKLLP